MFFEKNGGVNPVSEFQYYEKSFFHTKYQNLLIEIMFSVHRIRSIVVGLWTIEETVCRVVLLAVGRF